MLPRQHFCVGYCGEGQNQLGDQSEPRGEPIFRRIAGAWQVLMGQRLVPFQIQSEWAVYQQTFQAQLEQMSTYLARSAKAEKARLTRIQESLASIEDPAAANLTPAGPSLVGDRKARKAELWSRVSAGMGLSRPQMKREEGAM